MVILHSCCPKIAETWCKYQKDIINGTNTYNQSIYSGIYSGELKAIFERLSSPDLLSGCKSITRENRERLPPRRRVICFYFLCIFLLVNFLFWFFKSFSIG